MADVPGLSVSFLSASSLLHTPRRSVPAVLIVVGMAITVFGLDSGNDVSAFGLIVAQVGAFLIGSDWLGSVGRFAAVVGAVDRVAQVPVQLSRKMGLAFGAAALGMAGLALARLVADRPLAAISIVLAGLAVSRDVVIGPAHRVGASVRTLASVLTVTSLSFGPSWQLSAAGMFACFLVVAAFQSPEPPTILPALWQVVLGFVAMGLAVAVLWLSVLLSRTMDVWALLILAVLLGGVVTVAGLPQVQRQAGFEFRRSVEFDRGWPCAEIDMAGRLITVNDEWTAEVGDQTLEERVGKADWVRFAGALTQAQLTRAPIRLRTRGRADGDHVAVDSFEIMPGPPGISTGLLQLRIERQAVTVEEVEVLRSQANTDELTGLLNRRGLEAAVADRIGDTYHVVFADLNGFKAVNDYLGHEAGDEVLNLVATRLRALCRASDSVARLGGDEFVVVADTDLSDRRLRDLAGAMRFTYKGFQISASVGVAQGDGDSSYDEVLALADARMYEVKRQSKTEQSPSSQ